MRSRSLHLLLLAVALGSALAAPGSALAAPACANADTKPGNATEAVLAKSTVCLLNRERTPNERPSFQSRSLTHAGHGPEALL